jgi:CRISPR-associated protein Csx17
MADHVLSGLRPTPLVSYLAGLGLIRLLAEQADPTLRAAWTTKGLSIQTTVDDIATWLTDHYIPTPVLSPWNEGSGFGDKDKTPKQSLNALVSLKTPRLDPFRAAMAVAAEVGRQYRTDKSWTKEQAVQAFRGRCPEPLLPWIDATVVLTEDQAYFPPLLGTGGNDGRLDFSTTFHQRLLEVLDATPKGRMRARALAQDLLDGTQAERLSAAAIGQFDPAGAGGRNSSPYGGAESLVNPWAFVLLVEGALLFASSASRRHQHAVGRAAMPFTVAGSPDGYATGTAQETSRGEVWAPVWHRPFTLAEVKQLFTEARASWQGRPARRAIEFYAATRTLGVARGVDAFIRYGLHQRNGLAFVAIPIERIEVVDKPEVRLAARLEEWVSWVRRADTSTAVSRAVRRFDAAQWRFVGDADARSLAGLLAAVTDLEQAVGRSSRARENVPPRRPPSARWFLDLLHRGENSPELRVAVGIASCATASGPEPARTMRQLLLPIDPGPRWRDSTVVSGFGLRELPDVLADVLIWRARTAADEPALQADGGPTIRGVPTFRRGVPVPAADLHAFATGQLDQALLDLWLRACLALDWHGIRHTWVDPGRPPVPQPTLALLHPLAAGLAPNGTERVRDGDAELLAMSPDWPIRLAAGQITAVHDEAARRLRQAGWHAAPAPPPTSGRRSTIGVRIAAALVPRCHQPARIMREYVATRISTTDEQSTTEQSTDNDTADLMEEMA